MRGLENKYAIVTGGAKGIGLGIAARFILEKCKVLVIDKDHKALLDIPKSPLLETLHADIRDKEIIGSLLFTRRCDILVNNAAITDGDDWESIMDVNCSGTRYVTEAVLPGMISQESGSIVFITSVHTAIPFQGDAAYDTSKHAIVGYMKSRALELASIGIRMNAVAPGVIQRAGSNRHLTVQQTDALSNKIPMRRVGNPEDVARAVAFLASEEARYITGIELRVDGGLSIANPLNASS